MSSGFLSRKLATLAALVALLSAYYWVHKPATLNLYLILGGVLLDFLTVTLIAVIGGGIGRQVLARVNLSPLTIAERVALEEMVGLSLISISLLMVGLVGVFKGIVFAPLLAAIGIVVFRSSRTWLRDLRAILVCALTPRTTWTRLIALVVAVLLLLAALHAFAPPTAWDTMTYHLVIPQRYLASERISAYSDNHFMGFPQSMEMLYSLAISLFGRDTAAAPLHYWIGILGLMAVAGLARRYSDATAAWVAVLLLVSSYSLWVLLGWPYVDLAVMTFGILALGTAIRWRETRLPTWLILAGLCGGFALSVKYTAGGIIVALAVFTLLYEPRRWARNFVITVGAAALAYLPWAIKGIFLYENPIYPYLLNGLNWDNSRTTIFNSSGYGMLNSPDAWQLLVMPFSATVFGVEKAGRFQFTASPWLLTAPFLLLLPAWHELDERAKTLARDAFLYALPTLAIWIIAGATNYIGAETRLMMIGLPAAALLGGLGFYGLSRWPRKPLDVYFIVQAMLVFTTLLTVGDIVAKTSALRQIDYLAGNVTEDEYLTTNLGLYIQAMRQLETLPDGAKVLFMWEPKLYYCPAKLRCTPDVIFDHWSRPLLAGKTPDDVFTQWKENHYEYLLVFDWGYHYWLGEQTYLAAQNANFPAALDRSMAPIWSDGQGGYTLYGWRKP